MAFYLKYRPQTVAQLDNEEIRRRLTAFLNNPNFPHAFLLTGPKGVGKTSAARIIAKVINCLNGASQKKPWQFTETCNQCRVCQAINKGNSLDVLEIDAASNRGIDEIRILRERIGLAPSVCRYKVYIIDEVHMLTTEAFNALLKILEEPPKHVVFVLCTTERQKVPETIISRCVNLTFTKAKIEEMLRAFQRIVQGEALTISQEALVLLARQADGSFRDGAKLLEQLAAFKKNDISLTDVESILALEQIKEKEILALILKKQAKEALDLIDKAVNQGVDPKTLSRAILSELRRLLLEVVTNEKKEKALLVNLQKLINLFSKADSEIRYCPVSQLPLELAVVEYCFTERGEDKHV